MMKRIHFTRLILFTLLLSFGVSRSAHAQGTGGFFNQQASKVKLMLAQIAAYQLYLHELESGYHTTEKGLNTAHELKNGSFTLNGNYFNSLNLVSQAVQQNLKGKQMLTWQQQISTLFTNEITWQQQQKLLMPAEINTIQAVYQNLAAKCKADIDELNQVLSPAKLQLSDHERLERIDQLYAAMQDKYAFAGAYTSHCRALAGVRLKEQKDREQLKALYGIH